MNLFLSGMPMCGKTSVGKFLADKIQKKFIDTDELIEKTYFLKTGKQLTCWDLFVKEGEEVFRKLETQEIDNLLKEKDCIISLGGGTLINSKNVKLIKSLGTVIYLKTDLNEILTRMNQRGLPAFINPQDKKASLKKLADFRIPIYELTADFTIDTSNLCIEEIVNSLENAISKRNT